MSYKGTIHGISDIKSTMKAIQNKVKTMNEKSTVQEKEAAALKEAYLKSSGKKKGIWDRMEIIEEKLQETEKKFKEIQRRTLEKEKFLEESKQFTKSLKQVSPDEVLVEDLEERLNSIKETYQKNYEIYQKARNEKIELEQKLEISEIKAMEAMRRACTLRTELEYNTVEEERRTQGYKAAVEAASRSEQTCVDLQRGLDEIMKRKDAAMKQINRMEKEVHTKETAIDALKFERKRMEVTIKEMLINLKSQGHI